jgi:hypothetical protein
MNLDKPIYRSIAFSRNACFGAIFLVSAFTLGAACKVTDRTEPPVTKARPETKRVLGNFTPVTGTTHLMAPIISGRSSERSSSSSSYDSGQDAYNYVFLNSADDSTLTLLPTNDHLFVGILSLPEKREGDKEPPKAQWFLYGLVKTDTDADQELTARDRRSLCVSDAGGGGFKEIVEDVDQVYGHSLIDSDTLLVIYRKGAQKYLARINLPKREIVSTKELPTFGVDQ